MRAPCLAGLFLAVTATEAPAQMALYCEGRIAALYFNGQAPTANHEQSLRVRATLRLRNLTTEAIRYGVRFTGTVLDAPANGAPLATLDGNTEASVLLGWWLWRPPAQRVSLTPQQMLGFVQVDCPR